MNEWGNAVELFTMQVDSEETDLSKEEILIEHGFYLSRW